MTLLQRSCRNCAPFPEVVVAGLVVVVVLLPLGDNDGWSVACLLSYHGDVLRRAVGYRCSLAQRARAQRNCRCDSYTSTIGTAFVVIIVVKQRG